MHKHDIIIIRMSTARPSVLYTMISVYFGVFRAVLFKMEGLGGGLKCSADLNFKPI